MRRNSFAAAELIQEQTMSTIDRTLIPSAAVGDYAIPAAWPEDARIDDAGTLVLNTLGYAGPGAWADLEGGLILAGMIDADIA